MAALKTEGIVLKTTVIGESDLIAWLYTRELGLIRTKALGAKRSRKRFMNCLDLFCRIDCWLHQKDSRDLLRLDQARFIDRPELTHHPLVLGLAGLIAEMTLKFCPEQVPEADLYSALRICLTELPSQPDGLNPTQAYLIKLLHLSGFGPNVDACLVCGKPIDRIEACSLNPMQGGLTCSACGPGPGSSLSLGEAKTIRLCQRLDPEALVRVRFPMADRPRVLAALVHFAQHQLGRELSSVSFLRQLGLNI